MTATWNCLCSLDDDERIVAFNSMCPEHGGLAAPKIVRRWCTGSSEPVGAINGRYGQCRYCGNTVPQKRGYGSVHLPDGSTPSA